MRVIDCWKPMYTLALFAVVSLALATPSYSLPVAQEGESLFFTASDGARIHYLRAGETGSWVVLLALRVSGALHHGRIRRVGREGNRLRSQRVRGLTKYVR